MVIFAQIHILFTSALISEQFDQRKEEYITSFQQLRSFGLDPWIIEATNTDRSFFDELSIRVLYPQVNKDSISNKGFNEMHSLFACLPYLDFDDNDIVIKITGRYLLKDRHFIDTIEQTLSDYDVWGTYGKNFVTTRHLFTGCIAMRWRDLKHWISDVERIFAALHSTAPPRLGIEELSSEFIRRRRPRFYQMDSLHLSSRVFFNGGDEITTYEW